MQIDTDKTVVEARFYVSEIKLTPFNEYEYDSEGRPNYSKSHLEMGGTVTFSAAKHGTFGKATPFGNCTMGIQNQHAFLVFKEAYERIVKEKGRTPRFKVYFVEDENQEPDK
jgi:hypothetical protein